MSLSGSSSMEEIPLYDVDRTSIEYQVLLAYAQRQLSASKYGQLLSKETQRMEGSSSGKEDQQSKGCVPQDLSPKDESQSARNRSRKKKRRKRSGWKHCLLPSCLRVPVEKRFSSEDAVNGHALKPQGGVGGKPPVLSDLQDDSGISLVVDRLSEIIDHSRPRRTEFRILVHSVSLEADGTIQALSGDDDAKDEEERIINTIVALLRKSGDELQEQVKKDKTFSQLISSLMTYTFFSKLATQFSAEASGGSEMETQIMKVACAAEVTAKLTAIDNHPMNVVLGFGTKYLKENFSPWINRHGGWKALGLSDQEEVE